MKARIPVLLVLLIALAVACDRSDTDAPAADKAAEPVVTDEFAAAPADEPEDEVDGQWAVSETYGVRFLVPEDWNVIVDEDAVSATAPDDTTTVLLVGTESESVIEAAMRDMKARVSFSEVKIDRTDMTVINGMAGYMGSGSAVVESEEGDQEIQFLAHSLKVDEHGVSLLIFSEAEMYEAQRDIINGIAKTLIRN